MRRAYRVWVPSLFALLVLVGLGFALTNTSIGPANYVINGQPAPWYDGVLLAGVSFTALTFSLCGFYFPTWERRHAILREDVVVGRRRVPAIVFPYSTGALAFAACVAVMIAALCAIGNHFYLVFLGLPALVFLIRGLFGRQFVAITLEGLAWRVMPADPAQGSQPAGGKDYFTRQPVQFLPWDSIRDISLAEIIVSVSTRRSQAQVPAKMLRVSVSNSSALTALTPYQRVVPTASGADVLLPLGWVNPRSRYAKFGDGETRALPEAVWEAAEHYWRCPEERGQIGSALGAARLTSASEVAPAALSYVAVVPPDAGLNPRVEAQRLGRLAAKRCEAVVGAALGIPACLLCFALLFTGYLAIGYGTFTAFFSGWFLLVVLPTCVATGTAVASFIAPSGQETAAARGAVESSLVQVVVLGSMALAFDAWQYFDTRHYSHLAIPFLPLIAGCTLCGLALAAAYALGQHLGCAAKTTGPAWLARQLARWGRGLA